MNTYTKSELFSLANNLRKNGLTQKQAFAEAKKQLENRSGNTLFNDVYAAMQTRVVKFTYKNEKGRIITTTGTLDAKRIPVGLRVIKGRSMPRNDSMIVFYDTRHGQYRPLLKTNIIEVIK